MLVELGESQPCFGNHLKLPLYLSTAKLLLNSLAEKLTYFLKFRSLNCAVFLVMWHGLINAPFCA
jgi:hypothetical protein